MAYKIHVHVGGFHGDVVDLLWHIRFCADVNLTDCLSPVYGPWLACS